jgi:hypothetical protein
VSLDAAEVNLLGDELAEDELLLGGVGAAGAMGGGGAEGTFTTPDALAAMLDLGALPSLHCPLQVNSISTRSARRGAAATPNLAHSVAGFTQLHAHYKSIAELMSQLNT